MERRTSKLLKDLVGTRFGRLTVLEYAGYTRSPSGKKYHRWRCRCDCGGSPTVIGDSLRNGKTSSCGCLQRERTSEARREDFTGRTFGLLTALSFSHLGPRGETYWLCQCECGNKKAIASMSLKSGRSKSCGCRQGNFTHGMWGKPGYKKVYLADPVKKIKHLVSVGVRDGLHANGGSKSGQRTFSKLPYTPEELKKHLENLFEPWMTWDNYGGANDSSERTWHIDHVKPQASFSFASMDEPQFLECWALTNLRPLEKHANMARQRSRRTGRTESKEV